MTLSAGRWIFLLSLAVVMIFSTSGGSAAASIDLVAETCCYNTSAIKIPKIKACYEQVPRRDCNRHAYLVVSKRGKTWCISDNAPWLVNLIEKEPYSHSSSFGVKLQFIRCHLPGSLSLEQSETGTPLSTEVQSQVCCCPAFEDEDATFCRTLDLSAYSGCSDNLCWTKSAYLCR
ncbi:C-C motif chemokine 4-like [Xyrichtys novacula]|uniref:C-C motif chemokine 4-like n=1 Tax=Xyrichtys novacula TaxID=13765 RepID=A0AAV1HAI9_XYRNO|nr:C-C motif chemokine 4-like [Xyrichtys novacula]